jgi:hypothetical protein
MLEDLANSRYLMRAYAASSDSWENFRLTGRQSSLHEVAFALCGAWTVLSEDDDFFDGLADVPNRVGPLMGRATGEDREHQQRAAEFHQHLDVDRLLSRELVVLADAGMDPRHAIRLVTDLGDLLMDGFNPELSGGDVETLRIQAGELADELCKAQLRLRAFDYDPTTEVPAGRAPHRTWMNRMKTVGKALAATAGVASAAANVAASVASFGVVSGLGLASVVAGTQATAIAVSSIRAGD